MKQTVAILGASNKPSRYAYKALNLLREYGHQPIPVHPALDRIEDIPVMPNLGAIESSVDTLTLYVRPEISSKLKDDILKLNPKRVIFNPGTENKDLKFELEDKGIHTVEECTLVLLRSNRFDDA